MTELKPCPNPWCNALPSTVFIRGRCDGLDRRIIWNFVACGCGVEGPAFTKTETSHNEAIAAWNHRPGDEALARKVLEAAAGVPWLSDFARANILALNPAEILETK